MGIFLDTSFLIPLLIEHKNTSQAQEMFAEAERPLHIRKYSRILLPGITLKFDKPQKYV